MNITMKLQNTDFDDEMLQRLSGELSQSINQETDFQASIKSGESTLGTTQNNLGIRGDSIAIGEIALAVLGSGGAVVALIGVFKSFVERTKELSIKIKKQSGEELEITSKNIDSSEIESMFNKFFTQK